MNKYRAVALFSGGLDSILAVRIMQMQGWEVVGLHFYSPFFGNPELVDHWRNIHGLEIIKKDVSDEFVAMLLNGPEHGLGKFLNPCVDCKIFMLGLAKKYMLDLQARLIISGEVLGQRPMSQRRDALFLIRNRAGVKDVLLRPLSAGLFDPIPAESFGLVNRERLLSLSGRGRKEQIALAREMNIREIPTPGGGCLLTQAQSARRYLPVLNNGFRTPASGDFLLANVGRQYWADGHWLCVGRDKQDNERLNALKKEGDYIFQLKGFPGPSGIGRPWSGEWERKTIESGASWLSRFAPKARKSLRAVEVEVRQRAEKEIFRVWPGNTGDFNWEEPSWDPDGKKLFVKQAKCGANDL